MELENRKLRYKMQKMNENFQKLVDHSNAHIQNLEIQVCNAQKELTYRNEKINDLLSDNQKMHKQMKNSKKSGSVTQRPRRNHSPIISIVTPKSSARMFDNVDIIKLGREKEDLEAKIQSQAQMVDQLMKRVKDQKGTRQNEAALE